MGCAAGSWSRLFSRSSRKEFAAEWNRLQSEARANLSRIRKERERVCRQIDRLVDALADGEPAARLTERLEELHAALKDDDAGQARELIRGLVEAIVLVPEDGRLRIEVRGELAAILRLSGHANEKAPAGSPELLAEQIKMVAGAGFEPAAVMGLMQPLPRCSP